MPYKERLVAFRAAHYGEALPDAGKPAKGRLGDILQPILQVIRLVYPEREPVFLELVKEIEVGRQIEKSDSIEGEILLALQELSVQVEGGTLRVGDITGAVNKGKDEKSQVTPHRVGRRLSAMGFEKRRVGKNGVSAIVWNEVTVKQLCEEYGIEQPSETSDISDMWDTEGNPADITEDYLCFSRANSRGGGLILDAAALKDCIDELDPATHESLRRALAAEYTRLTGTELPGMLVRPDEDLLIEIFMSVIEKLNESYMPGTMRYVREHRPELFRLVVEEDERLDRAWNGAIAGKVDLQSFQQAVDRWHNVHRRAALAYSMNRSVIVAMGTEDSEVSW